MRIKVEELNKRLGLPKGFRILRFEYANLIYADENEEIIIEGAMKNE